LASAFISADTVDAATEPQIRIRPPVANSISMTPEASGEADPVRSGNDDDVAAASGTTVTGLTPPESASAHTAADATGTIGWYGSLPPAPLRRQPRRAPWRRQQSVPSPPSNSAGAAIPASSANTTGGKLTSFDISWIDPTLRAYFLADRSNNAIDVINTQSKQVIQLGVGDFAGAVVDPVTLKVNSDFSGPNGVLTIPGHGSNDHDRDADDRGNAQIWAGDGPKPGMCTPAKAAAFSPDCSSVKILSYPSGALLNVVPAGGVARADELCYDPKDHLVMVANDADNPPFVTFISTEGHNKVLGQIKIPESNGGIEQCQWNPRNGLIYLNIPSTTDDSNGKVYVIEPRHEQMIAEYDATDGCQPAGMAIGPDHQILLGCGGPDALVMSDGGSILATIPSQGGADEVWFNPGDGHYFLAESNNKIGTTANPQLGIVDSRNAAVDQDIKTGLSSHSVAADPFSMQAYVPITATGGGSATLCSNSPTNGCVAIFGPSGPDDHPVFVARDHH
jgi:hypothetical protein